MVQKSSELKAKVSKVRGCIKMQFSKEISEERGDAVDILCICGGGKWATAFHTGTN